MTREAGYFWPERVVRLLGQLRWETKSEDDEKMKLYAKSAAVVPVRKHEVEVERAVDLADSESGRLHFQERMRLNKNVGIEQESREGEDEGEAEDVQEHSVAVEVVEKDEEKEDPVA